MELMQAIADSDQTNTQGLLNGVTRAHFFPLAAIFRIIKTRVYG